MAKLAQWDIDVPDSNVDFMQPRLIGRIARDIALALPVPHEPQLCRPVLPHALASPSPALSSETVCGS
jgi:hypothetical protein